jgi:hypothetical protein
VPDVTPGVPVVKIRSPVGSIRRLLQPVKSAIATAHAAVMLRARRLFHHIPESFCTLGMAWFTAAEWRVAAKPGAAPLARTIPITWKRTTPGATCADFWPHSSPKSPRRRSESANRSVYAGKDGSPGFEECNESLGS